ncbi:MAG: hypothetical protein AB7F50_04910 [Fimbriimonadaceae bacterium]
MESACPSQSEILEILAERSGEAPFLALGQTVFWDEPMKAGLVLRARELGHDRKFIAGVHDTDYFAKAPGQAAEGPRYEALPHNDSSTRGLWSASGEFSTLFGSETVVTRERLAHSGVQLSLLEAERPGSIDALTEAWGWRGVVGRTPRAETAAETRLDLAWPTLWEVFNQMVDQAAKSAAVGAGGPSWAAVERLKEAVCDASSQGGTLADFYERLTPQMFEFAAGTPVQLEATRTTRLLAFDEQSACLPRFKLLAAFLDPATRRSAEKAYDDAVAHSEIYDLARFGTGALPFDVLVPGVGRGTLRLGSRGGVVQASHPVGFRYERRPETPQELARLLEGRFGPGVVVLGKAIALIAMLSTEFVFVMHSGASGYVHRTAQMVRGMRGAGIALPPSYPILRIEYPTWDALDGVSAWFHLPEPLQGPFGTRTVSACGFAARWKLVAQEQQALLEELAVERSPIGLIRLLARRLGDTWVPLASQFEQNTALVVGLRDVVAGFKARKAEIAARQQDAVARRAEIERQLGEHWRAKVWNQTPTEDELARREELSTRLRDVLDELHGLRADWRRLDAEQATAVGAPDVVAAKERRRVISVEAGFARAELVKSAVFASDGLERAGLRPGAWWFSVVSPDGAWFRATSLRAKYCLEELA